MIDTISTVGSTSLMDTVRRITQDEQAMLSGGISKTQGAASSSSAPSFGDMLSGLINSVDEKSKIAQTDAKNLMTGKTSNIHQAMLSMQEAGVAFTMMTEVRNKLVAGYQELMRMQV